MKGVGKQSMKTKNGRICPRRNGRVEMYRRGGHGWEDWRHSALGSRPISRKVVSTSPSSGKKIIYLVGTLPDPPMQSPIRCHPTHKKEPKCRTQRMFPARTPILPIADPEAFPDIGPGRFLGVEEESDRGDESSCTSGGCKRSEEGVQEGVGEAGKESESEEEEEGEGEEGGCKDYAGGEGGVNEYAECEGDEGTVGVVS